MRLECLSCHGVYDAVGPDGLRYFHVCPPLSGVELVAAVTRGKVQLPAGETVADAMLRRTYLRKDRRDENVTRPIDPDAPAAIVREGKGVKEVAPGVDDPFVVEVDV